MQDISPYKEMTAFVSIRRSSAAAFFPFFLPGGGMGALRAGRLFYMAYYITEMKSSQDTKPPIPAKNHRGPVGATRPAADALSYCSGRDISPSAERATCWSR